MERDDERAKQDILLREEEIVCWACEWYPTKCKGLRRGCVENDYCSFKGGE